MYAKFIKSEKWNRNVNSTIFGTVIGQKHYFIRGAIL